MNFATGITVFLIFLVLIVLGPLVFLWSVNTLASHAGADLYVPHNFWTYLASYGLFVTVGGSSAAGKSG